MFRISAELGCKIIRISLDAKDLAKETTKKSFIKSLSERLSNLKFNADHSIRYSMLFKKYRYQHKIWKPNISSNKLVRQSSKCANCVAEKSRFLKQPTPNKQSILKTIYMSTYWHVV